MKDNMKKIFLSLMTLAMAVGVMAVPARKIVKDITLSDGTVVANVVLAGDECFHYWLAPDGTRYQETSEGVYEAMDEAVAQQSIRRASARKAAAQEASSIRRTQTLNLAPRGLLILVNFSDKSFLSSNTQAEMDSMLNGQNYNYDISIGSARKYFYDQSNGTYNPHFDVVGPVTLPKTMAYYGGNGSGDEGSDQKLGDMVLHACSIASGLSGVDLANYDNNNDGTVDFVYLIYAGYGEADGGGANTIWPASWDMSSAVQGGYTSLSTRATKSSYTFDGKAIGSFAYSPELNYYNSVRFPTRGYSSSNPMRGGIGTFCHEFSHVIGLPDYYDTNYGTNYDNNLTPGLWSLMDGGSYNGDGQVPPYYSTYDKYYVGWATPSVLNSAQNVTLPADHQTGYYITSNGSTATPTTASTVYYLENRQQTGWDAYLPGHGMIVWKVTYNSSKWDNNSPNNTANSPCYQYIPADGSYSDDQGDSGDPFPGTSNVRKYTPYSAYPLTDITETSGVISFKFMGGTTCTGYNVTFNGTKTTLSAESTECLSAGSSWTGTLTANTNCVITSVSVTMGGASVNNAYTLSADGTSATLSVANVTGDIVVNAVAERQGGASYITCDSYSWTASAKVDTGSSVALGDYTWSVVMTGGTFTGLDSSRGAQFGSGSSPATRVSLTTEETTDCLIQDIVVNAAMASSGTGKLSVYIDGTQVGSTKSLSTSATNYTFSNSDDLQGNLEIRYTNTAKALYLKAINLTFQEGTTTDIPTVNTQEPSATKIIRNGKIFIVRGEEMFDLLGNKIQ